MRRQARLDGNHSAIVRALREAGCSVQSLATIGNGCPDILIARNGRMWLAEIKDGSKPPSQRKLTLDEQVWKLRWNAPVHVVESVEQALRMISL